LTNFSGWFVDLGVLNNDHIVCLDGARPPNTCIPPYYPGNGQSYGVPTLKSVFASVKKGKNTFYILKNQRKCLANSFWATMNLPIVKFGIFTCLLNLVTADDVTQNFPLHQSYK
jgi:hypothetical protein